jgi:lipopolysaccharide transport system permease protein
MKDLLVSLWAYRHFLLNSIWNDFRARFVRSRLGAAWIVFQPLSQVLIYAFILSNLLSAKVPGIENTYGYAIYLMSGLLAWNLFSEVLDRCIKVFVSNANAIKKVNFPRVTLPIIEVGAAITNNIILLAVMVVIFLILGHPPGWPMLLIFLMIPLIALFAMGIGLFLGVVNVFIRDVEQVTPIILQVLFWLTPIVYPSTIIPETYMTWMRLNPVFQLVDFYHQVIVQSIVPSFTGVLIVGAIGAVASVVALLVFRRAGPDMVDVL